MNLRTIFYPKGKAANHRQAVSVADVLFVDPGLGGVGWAFFPSVNVPGHQVTAPSEAGVLRVGRVDKVRGKPMAPVPDWQGKVKLLCTQFHALLTGIKPGFVVIEFPAMWGGSSKSHASAASKKAEPGDLFKLAYLVGGFGEMVRREVGLSPVLVEARDWKGQLPKKVVIARFRKRFRSWETDRGKKVRDHEGDAIGMGLAAQGAL